MPEVTPGGGWWKAQDGEWYPPRWEYKFAEGWMNPKRGHEPLLQVLETMGRQGWEAVALSNPIASPTVSASFVAVLMKRPIR